MSRPGLPRWAALAALPLLVGAVLLMHGLDAGAHSAPETSVTADPRHSTR